MVDFIFYLYIYGFMALVREMSIQSMFRPKRVLICSHMATRDAFTIV